MEGLTHPGYIDIKDISKKAGYGDDHFKNFDRLLTETRGRKHFEDFMPFIKTKGLAGDQKEKFLNLLKELYLQDGKSWEPENCQHATTSSKLAKKIIAKNPEFRGLNVEPRRLGRVHFWLVLEGFDKTLIIDPWGIPEDFPKWQPGIPEKILPFIGPVSQAPNNIRKLYTNGAALDDWGTRDLPPGFHP